MQYVNYTILMTTNGVEKDSECEVVGYKYHKYMNILLYTVEQFILHTTCYTENNK